MTQTIYTNYWISRIGDVRKEHGSYKTEEEALEGIQAWWDLHNEKYSTTEQRRTNTGALEIIYQDDISFYRIEKREIEDKLPSRSYRKKGAGEIEALRSKYQLNEEAYVFDELAEPFRDRLILAMADSKKVRSFIYDVKGRPIREIN